MIKRFKMLVGLVPCILVFLLLAACTNIQHVNEPPNFVYSETIEPATDTEIQLALSTTQPPTVQDIVKTTVCTGAYCDEGIGGFWGCEIHHDIFHNLYSFQLIPSFVSDDAFLEWAIPLWDLEEQTGECLVNLLSFITYFGITREAFQAYVDGNIRRYFQFGGDIIDVLFSGDSALIEQYFSVNNAMLIWQERMDRQEIYWNERVTTAQRRVRENTSEMSWYFHDVWTYFYLTDNSRGWYYTMWMRDIVEAGEYESVNIAEFIEHFELDRPSSLSPGITIFEHWANYFNMNIFTHYNFDILLSGDWNLIRDYYCITNEPLHTAQVQARFNAYVAANGYTQDTSWMVGRPPTQITINPATATVQRGGQQQFSAAATGPGNTQQAVTWVVQGSASSGTTITEAGLLHVAQDETAATLTVRAASVADANVYDTAAVTVTAPSHGGTPPAAGPSAPSGTGQRPPADSNEHGQPQEGTTPGDIPAPGPIPVPDPIADPAPFTNPFVDVHERDWFFDYVMYVYAQGLMTGMDTTPMTFAPNAHMTRAMTVQVLYNMEGRPSVAGLPNPFTDVAQDAWYRDAVVWAANNGVVVGFGGGIFAPGNNITRAHLTLILSNYSDFAGITLPLIREYQAFTDDSDIRYYAREAVERLFRAAVINGRPDGSFDPQGNATRAELATMMHNFS